MAKLYAVLLLFLTAGYSFAQKPVTVETNVRTVLEIHGFDRTLDTALVRKAVVVMTPKRLPNGQFDHSFKKFIEANGCGEVKVDGCWIKSPRFVSWMFSDGKHPFRERIKEGGLEADWYEVGEKMPDYIRKLAEQDAQKEKEFGIPAPPYYFKMDVDYGYGVRNFFHQELPHMVLHKSTDQNEIAEILQKRKLVIAAKAAAVDPATSLKQ